MINRMVNNGSIVFQSPVRLVTIMAFSIFLIELFLMVILHYLFPSIHPAAEIVSDAALLVLLLSPFLYLFLFRPLSTHLAERRIAENALELEESKLKAILDSMADGIYMVNRNHEIEYINPVLEKEFGAINDRRCFEYFHDRTESCPWCKNPEVFSGNSVRWEWHSSKTGRTYDLFDTPVKHADGTVSKLEIFRDITVRKQVENEIRQHYDIEAAISFLLRLSLEEIPVEKLLEQTLDRILSIPWFAFESMGSIYLLEDESGGLAMRVWKGLPDAARKSCATIPLGKCLCGLAASTRKIQFAACCDERHEIRYDGITPHAYYCVPILSGNKLLGVINVYLKACHPRNEKEEGFLAAAANTLAGIIMRKQAEESLRESEERYKRLTGSVTDYIYTVKVRDGRPVSTSHGPGCVAVTGYASGEYETDPDLWFKMVYEEDRRAVIEQGVNVISGKSAQPLEHRIIHKDGGIRWVRSTPVPRSDEHGRIIAYDGLISDVTERRKLEDQLRHAQKMEAIGTLTGGIAHDFNNILTAMMGYGNLLKMKVGKDKPLGHNVEQILTLAEKAAGLTHSLLAFGRKQTSNMKQVSLNEIIKRMEKMLARVIGEDIELKTILSDKELPVMVDSGQMEQVLMNLCINARDAMPDGGAITIETRPVDVGGDYISMHGYGEPGAYALVSVADTGVGMDQGTKERIFEPFFTTKESGKGTGLGLSIVYGIIKQHNGYIDVLSAPGKGARFDIRLPLVNSVKAVEDISAEPVAPVGGGETILLAEDESSLRKVVKEVIEGFGYMVIDAENGLDAIEKFKEHKDKVKLLILDVVMPGKNGKDAYDEIRKVSPGIRALFVSGYPEDVVSRKGIIEEGLTLIPKPVSPDILLRKVREVLDK